MTVRAKFVCTTKTTVEYNGGKQSTVELTPVYNSDPESENGKFYAATPSGSITLSGLHEVVAEKYTPGKEYYVDFTPAD